MWRAFAGGVALSIAFGMQSAQAADPIGFQQPAVTKVAPWLEIEAYAGYLTGRSREIVYDPATGQRISQLNWDIKSAGVLGGNIAIKPADWVRLRFGGWLPFTSNNHMEDYDWLVPPYDTASHVSVHPDTRLQTAYQLDAQLGFRIINGWGASVYAVGGYRQLHYGWTAYGGTYSYPPPFGSGTIPSGLAVIKYEQWFETPYFGLSGEWKSDSWWFNGEVVGSFWSTSRDRDDHILRRTLFEEEATGVKVIVASASLGYEFTPTLSAFGRVEYQHHFEGRGATDITLYDSGTRFHIAGDAAGLDNYSLVVAFGFKGKL
jgi:plasminogen activator